MKPSANAARRKRIFLFGFYILLCAAVLFTLSWTYLKPEDPVKKFEALKLLPDAEVFLDTKGEFSAVNWSHYTVEKVIRCEQGLDYVRNYVLENNDPSDLTAVLVLPFDSLTDMNIYSFDSLDDETRRMIREDGLDKYIRIEYWHLGYKGNKGELIKK